MGNIDILRARSQDATLPHVCLPVMVIDAYSVTLAHKNDAMLHCRKSAALKSVHFALVPILSTFLQQKFRANKFD
jgi:hypothetical protein